MQNIVQKIMILLVVAGFSLPCTLAQQITRIEYFIDTDPGFGNASSITITPATFIADLPFNADISLVSDGFHHLFVRSYDGASWSTSEAIPFIKGIATNNQLQKLEYFIGTDPGIGNGTEVLVQPALPDVVDYAFVADASSAPAGFNILSIRSFDGSKWSITQQFAFIKGMSSGPLQKLEYFTGTDPGFGKGAGIVLPALPDVTDQAIAADISNAPQGFNIFSVRSFDGNSWSITNQYAFIKGVALSAVESLEYFIDADPGFGNGTTIGFTPGLNISDHNFPVDISLLTPGVHHLFMRSLDAAGIWSITAVFEFTVGSPVPVSLLQFNAKASGKMVQLDWQTANEINNDRFFVERSFDGRNFNSIGSIAGRGNSGTLQQYRFTDDHPNTNGNNWYRLKQVDLDGRFTHSPIRLIKFSNGNESRIAVFPTISSKNIVIYNVAKGNTIALFDMSGRLLQQQIVTNQQQQIDIHPYPAGTYFIVVHQQGAILATQKIVRE